MSVDYLTDSAPPLDDVQIDTLLELAVITGRRAGSVAEASRNKGVNVATTKSNELDIVTQADLETEALIKEAILAVRPNDGFLGEETEEVVGTDDLTWLVDPIDGTVNYLYGDSSYAVSIAAFHGSMPVVGVVYSPGLNELWSASYGGGAWLNGEAVRTRASISADQPLLGTVFDYTSDTRTRQMQRLADRAATFRDLRVSGSTALDLCRVAAGRLDVFCTDSVNWWDIGAGVLIAREAGCRTWAEWNRESKRVHCIVSNPAVPQEFPSSLGYGLTTVHR